MKIATQRVNLKPKKTGRIMLENPPMEVNRLFIPQTQAIVPLGWLRIAEILNGNGMPKKNPKGNIIKKETKRRTGIGEARK